MVQILLRSLLPSKEIKCIYILEDNFQGHRTEKLSFQFSSQITLFSHLFFCLVCYILPISICSI